MLGGQRMLDSGGTWSKFRRALAEEEKEKREVACDFFKHICVALEVRSNGRLRPALRFELSSVDDTR